MLNSYFIEFRFHGYPKHYLRGLINDVAHKFKVKGAIKYRPVPHMTLFGPFQTTEFQSIFSKIEKVCKKHRLVPFEMQGFDWRNSKNGKVIAVGVSASPELSSLRKELAKELIEISTQRQSWDSQNKYWFHSTIAMKDIDHKFDRIWSHVNSIEKPHINQHLIRITVLNRKRRIEREYDLVLQRWLDRREALSKRLFQKTVSRLRELQGLPAGKPTSLIDWLRRLFGGFG